MATFEAQLSAQISQGQSREILDLLNADGNWRVSKADVIRAALRLGLPLLAELRSIDRLKLYATIHRGE